MKSKNLSLKHILTTASTLALIVGASSEASAAAAAGVYIIHGGNVQSSAAGGTNFKTQADLANNAGNPLAAATNYDLVYAGTVTSRTFDQNVAGVTITSINTSSGITGTAATAAPGLMTIGAATSIGSITQGTLNPSLLAITVPGANVLTLTGSASTSAAVVAGANNAPAFVPVAKNHYAGLGTVTLADAGAGLTLAATTDGVTFANDIIADANGDGILTITAGATGNIFTGNIGGVANSLASSAINESVTFRPAAGKGAINLGTTAIADTKTLTIDSTNEAATVRGAINGAVANQGILAINAVANNVTIAGVVGGTAIKTLTITGDADTTFSNNVATNANIDASASTGDVTFSGTVNGANVLTSQGITTFNKTSGTAAFTLPTGSTMAVTTAGADITITGAIDGAAAGDGILAIDAVAHDVTIVSAVGNTEILDSVTVTGANDTTFNAVVKAGAITATGAGALDFIGAVTGNVSTRSATTFDGAVDGTITSTASVILNKANGTYTNAIVSPIVTLGADATFEAGATVTATTELDINNHTLNLEGGAINAKITGNNGTLNINANQDIIGNIGVDGANLTKVNVGAGFGLDVTGSIYSDVIHLTDATSELITSANATIVGPIEGDGIVTTRGNTIFKSNIGAGNLAEVRFNALAGGTITLDGTANIQATDIFHHNTTINTTAQHLTITGNYDANNATWVIGDKTVTITGGTVTLAGDIVIKADYRDAAHVSVDLTAITAANLIEGGVTSLTFEVTGGVAPAPDTVMTIISPLAAGGNISILPGNITLTPSGRWTLSAVTAGQLIYDPTPAVVQAQQRVLQALDSTGATSSDLAAARKVRIDTLGGKGVITNDGSTPGAAAGQKVLHIIDPTKFTPDLSTEAGAKALLASLTPEIRDGFLSDCELLMNESDGTVFIPKNTAAAYAIVAREEGSITPIMADAMIRQDEGGISQGLVQDIINVSREKDAHRAIEMSDRIIAAHTASSVTLDAVSSRTALTHFQTSTFTPVLVPSNDLVAEAEGIAAGSSAYDKFGIWGSINGGKATQKQRKGNDGFRSTSQAIVLGADTMVNDNTSIGFAVSHSMNHMKHKNNSAGNKTDAVSWIGSLYGTHQLKNNWFVRGTALYNNTNINNKERRVIVGNYGIAQGKYKVISYGGEANVGFSHKLQKEIIITPTVGLRVLHTNKVSYAETGNTNQNHKNITQKAMNNYSALARLSVAKTIVKNDIAFTPEAHANLQYGINMKAPSGSFVSPLTPLQNTSFVGTRASKLTSTYGLSLTGSNDRIECAVSADVNIAEKYVGYTGALKLKVKF